MLEDSTVMLNTTQTSNCEMMLSVKVVLGISVLYSTTASE